MLLEGSEVNLFSNLASLDMLIVAVVFHLFARLKIDIAQTLPLFWSV